MVGDVGHLQALLEHPDVDLEYRNRVRCLLIKQGLSASSAGPADVGLGHVTR